MPRKPKPIRVSLVGVGDRPWQLRWRDPATGKQRWRSAETYDGDEAEQKRAALEYELNHGLHVEPAKMTWPQFRERYEAEHQAALRPRSREKWETVATVFERLASPRRLGDIDEQTLSRFAANLREAGRKPWTIRNYLAAIRAALRWAEQQRLIPRCPAVPVTRIPRVKPKAVPAEAVERLLEAEADPKWRAMMACGWWAGLRLSEAWQLRATPSDRWPWVDWKRDRIVLPAAAAKANADQEVPLHPTLRAAIEALAPDGDRLFLFRSKARRYGGEILNRTSVTNHVRAVAKRAGVRLSMHDLRRGFGSRLAPKVSAAVLQTLMRHGDIRTTMEFYVNTDSEAAKAIEGLE